jgi:hypothetical protein
MRRKLTFPVFDGDNHRAETREVLATVRGQTTGRGQTTVRGQTTGRGQTLARLMRTGA